MIDTCTAVRTPDACLMPLLLLVVIREMTLAASSGANIVSSMIADQKQAREQCVICVTKTHVREIETCR